MAETPPNCKKIDHSTIAAITDIDRLKIEPVAGCGRDFSPTSRPRRDHGLKIGPMIGHCSIGPVVAECIPGCNSMERTVMTEESRTLDMIYLGTMQLVAGVIAGQGGKIPNGSAADILFAECRQLALLAYQDTTGSIVHMPHSAFR